MIKIGLIGIGFMGGTHAACYEALLNSGDFKVTAVADLDMNKAGMQAGKFGAEAFQTGMDLIENGDINVADICLPTYLHTDHAIKAMEKGLDVFIEKPVCINEEEACRLLEMKRKTGVKVAVGQCIRFWDEYVFLKKLIDHNTYGKLINGVFKRISSRPAWGWEQWLMNEKKSGLAALDLHIHDVDFVRYILGYPDLIKSEIPGVNNGKEHIFSLYRYGNAIISIEGGWDYPSGFPFEMEYRVRFEKATVTFSSARNPSLMIYEEAGTVFEPKIDKAFESQSEGLRGNISSLGGYYNEIKYFIECLKQGKQPEIAPLEEGIESFRLTVKEIAAALK